MGSGGCFTQVEHPPFYIAARGLARLPLNGVPAAKLRAGHARPLRSTRGSDLPLPGVFSGATGGHGAVKTAPYKPPAIAASRGGMTDCRKRCAHPLAPSARGLRPQAVGERTVRLPEIFRAMARFSPSAPSGHLPRRGRFFGTLPPLCQGRLFHFGTFFHLFCSIGIFFDCFAQIGCFCGSYYTIMIKYRRMYIFTARLLRLEL